MKEDKNILTIGIVIGVIAILLIGSLYFIGPEHKGLDSSIKTSTSHASNSNEIIINVKDAETSTRIIITAGPLPPDRMPNIEVFFTEIPHNTKPVFKIGDKFEYVSVSSIVGDIPIHNISEEDNISPSFTSQIPGKTICNVVKKERLKGEEYYVVECNDEWLDVMMGGGIRKTKEIYYISTENGEIRKVVSTSVFIYKNVVETIENFSEEIQSPNSKIYNALFYSPWMLSLSDDFKMEIKTSHHTTAKIEISVIDKEKIKNRDCYVVESRELDKNNNVVLRKKMWIDKEKRVLVVGEAYLGSLRIFATEMVSDIR